MTDIPEPFNWGTTDVQELNRRKLRAREESFEIRNLTPTFPIFSNFQVRSGSGRTYIVEVYDPSLRLWACNCTDFRVNGLGTCKHAEAVANHLSARFRRLWAAANSDDSPRIDVVPDRSEGRLRIVNGLENLAPAFRKRFSKDGENLDLTPFECLKWLESTVQPRHPNLRIFGDVREWLEQCRRQEERVSLRREYEQKVQSGEWPEHETLFPLYPYQREGMLHLAFKERALLADEMGLGKTIQAIAACALLHRMGKARRILVVTPASLKTEWEEQILRFTPHSLQLVFGSEVARRNAYLRTREEVNPPVFTVTNYEQMIRDAEVVNQFMEPDVVVLDEAQRIKNWNTKTSQAIKRLRSRYAFVLTGTPIENRIDELYSLMDFLDPSVLGSLFRFNREYYELDERGRPAGYKNLQNLHDRIAPHLLRRRKSDVENQLPDRTDRNHFVQLSPQQKSTYDDNEAKAARLASKARRGALRKEEMELLMLLLAKMRMICDTNFILDPKERTCPKLGELRSILEEVRSNPGVKIIIFSEWEKMLQLVRGLCGDLKLGFAWHTGSVPQIKRRAEINAFKNDPDCRVFLSTDSGSTGLNLQVASVVINCDLPWNPAKLEQRIARAWRKHQTRPVTVINLVSENTIEHRMLETLANKQALSDGVLDLRGDFSEIKLRSGRDSFLSRLKMLIPTTVPASVETPAKPVLPADRPLGFAASAAERMGHSFIACEERFPAGQNHTVLYVVVKSDAAQWRNPMMELHEKYFADRDPMSPMRLEVVDQATHDAVERLIEAGLIQRSTRAARNLQPGSNAVPPSLSADQLRQMEDLATERVRQAKLAKVLGDAGFVEETRAPLMVALLNLARALSIQHRQPMPTEASDALRPPLSLWVGEALPVLRAWTEDPLTNWLAAVSVLSKPPESVV